MIKRFTADYIYLIDEHPLKNGVVSIDANGRIIDISTRLQGNETYVDGIICPGFINVHCHTELSFAKDKIEPNLGIDSFIYQLEVLKKKISLDAKNQAVIKALEEMLNNGIVAVGDIMNTDLSINAKRESNLLFYNFIEVFGSQYKDAENIWYSALSLFDKADKPKNIVPHAPYSLSRTLFQKLRDFNKSSDIISMHHLESKGEIEYFESGSGPIADRMKKWGLSIPAHIPTSQRPLKSISEFIVNNDNILLIHNSFADNQDVEFAKETFNNTYYGLCPKANLFIEKVLPPIDMLMNSGVNICLGTDSLASNNSLSIFDEMKTIDKAFKIPLEELIAWATINGAKALNLDLDLGSISIGKKPGLIAITNLDKTDYHRLANATFSVLR